MLTPVGKMSMLCSITGTRYRKGQIWRNSVSLAIGALLALKTWSLGNYGSGIDSGEQSLVRVHMNAGDAGEDEGKEPENVSEKSQKAYFGTD